MRPNDSPTYGSGFFEIIPVTQLLKNAKIQERGTVVCPHLSIGKSKEQDIFIGGDDRLYSRVHELPQWIDFVNGLTIDRKLPIGHEIVSVDFYPGLDKFHLVAWNFSTENFAFRNGYNHFMFLLFHMYMWSIVLLVINIIKRDDNPIKHRYDGHSSS
jgi:hypothetical protein